MKAFGDYLRHERELRGISLDELAQSTKISPSILASLEGGHLESLPPIAFVKGFLRAYAEYVGLDPASVVLRFEAAFLADEAEARRGRGFAWPRVRRLAGITAALAALTAVAVTVATHGDELRALAHRRKEAPAPAPPPVTPSEPASPSDEIDKLKQELGLKEIERHIGAPPVEVPTDPPSALTQVPDSLSPIFHVPPAGPGDAGGAEPRSRDRRAEAPATSLAKPGTGTPAATATSGVKLVLHGLARTWVQVASDDGEPVSRELEAGEDWALAGRRFVLLLGDGGAVSLGWEGRDLGAAGAPGVLVRLEIPKDLRALPRN
ncbi:MAG: helix-turn-helix domain-containing protein [bacterium]